MSDMMTQEEAMNMSNEQAVQILIPMRNMMCDRYGCPVSDAVFALDKAIEALSADRPQGWIPCSERVPNENGDYLVTLENGVVKILGYSTTQRTTYPKGFYHIKDGFSWRQIQNPVVAWMPLPKMWEGADDEADNN